MSASGRRTSSGLLQFAAILLIFLVAGPPIGAITFFLLITLLGMGAKTDIGALVWMTLFAAIYAVPLSYLLGAIPALLAGAAVATGSAVCGRAAQPSLCSSDFASVSASSSSAAGD